MNVTTCLLANVLYGLLAPGADLFLVLADAIYKPSFPGLDAGTKGLEVVPAFTGKIVNRGNCLLQPGRRVIQRVLTAVRKLLLIGIQISQERPSPDFTPLQ